MKVYICNYTHRFGSDITVHASRKSAEERQKFLEHCEDFNDDGEETIEIEETDLQE